MAAYGNSCVFCHGSAGTGGHGGPAFNKARSIEEIQRVVAIGGNTMPAFGNTLNDAQIRNVSAWVVELAQRAADD
jgi:mono/diheme cytochrome c family protein